MMMALDSENEDAESEPKEPDFDNGDLDVHLNHYRISKLSNYANNARDGSKGSSSFSSSNNREQIKFGNEGKILSLTELAAQKVACHLPFGQVEHFDPPVPEPMQCRIAFWSFPQDEEAVRLYTCLANGNADVFIRAEDLISLNCVCDMLQVGFHLSANVKYIQDSTDDLGCFRVAITFDRRRITSCSCSCSAPTFWCVHAVAVCLQRIRKPCEVTLRAPVSESLQRLEKNQLQKFAQYLINELPQQILPAAQKLLDELLSGEEAIINKNPGAPDPTAGATIHEQTSWCLDDTHLSLDIRKILLKQCTTQPIVCSDPQSLDETPPPAAAEYSQLLRPIKGREPEGLWNLISIVGEMMKRRDSNYFLLLEIITEEVLHCEQIVSWWFETKVSLHSGSTFHCSSSQRKKEDKECTSQYTCSNFCDEIVHLWRLAALDPSSSPSERKKLFKKFFDWHLEILKGLINGTILDNTVVANRRNFLELFPGFKPSMEGCLIDWSDWDDKNSKIVGSNDVSEYKESKSAQKRKKKKLKALKALSEAATSSTSEQTAQLDDEDENEPVGKKATHDKKEIVSNENKPCTSGSHQPNENVLDDAASGRRPLQVLNENPRLNVVEAPRVEPDLQIYFMDRQVDSPSRDEQPEALEDMIRVNTKKLKDNLEILYAKAEGLHAHGHLEQSLQLALKVVDEILSHPNYPSIKQIYNIHRRRRKKGSLDNQMSIVASEVLSKIIFLCNVLLTNQDHHNLVFKLVLFGVEMKRLPAATKPLEVKLINQKQDLIMLLKSIALHEDELKILREAAQAIRDGVFEQDIKSEALTTLILGNYIFEALVLSKSPPCSSCNHCNGTEVSRNGSNGSYNQSLQYHQLEEHYLAPGEHNQQMSSHNCGDHMRQPCSLKVYGKLPTDTSLGFHAALNAISVKVNVSEVDHPLLCEGIRRQRGELVLSLLTHYKDDQEKLDLILKHLLDNDVVLSLNVADLPKVASTSSMSKLTQKASSSKLVNSANSAAGSSSDISERQSKVSSTPAFTQPTEASSHFMFELAKTVFEKAGGNSMTAHLFRPQLVAQNAGRGIHRRLHMCTLRLALYALDLQNRTSANWMERNYNGRASFIHEQALEIGLPAIKLLSENWDGHLSPLEVVSIADKASCLDDAETKRVAAEMAKSCLKYANHLDFHAVRRIFGHCEKQSVEMIEEACGEIEKVAENGNVCSDVLFATSRAWYGLYERLAFEDNQGHHNSCYVPSADAPTNSEQEPGAPEWLVASPQSTIHHEKQYNQFCEPAHWMHRDDYIRSEYIPTLYLPTHKHIEYVKSSFRVGIKALDALKLTPLIGNKHNPKKEDDVIWLLNLCKSLDKSLEWSENRECLHKFTQSVIKNITNPQILHIISKEFIVFFKGYDQDDADRVKILLPLIDKSLDRFVKQTRDLMKHISYDQKNVIETIMDQAQELTGAANTLTAYGHFKELLKIVDSKKPDDNKRTRKSRGIYIDTYLRHKWANDQLSLLRHCCCVFCRTGLQISYNALDKTLKHI